MPKCRQCGNSEVFVRAVVEVAKYWYDEQGEVAASKFLDYGDEVDGPWCGECDSTDIEQ